jgi:hypothetical protein
MFHAHPLFGQAHVTHLYDMTALRKTGANLLIKAKEEWDHLENDIGVVPIGICGDASGDERKMRSDFLKEKLWALIADCWGHQVLIDLCRP